MLPVPAVVMAVIVLIAAVLICLGLGLGLGVGVGVGVGVSVGTRSRNADGATPPPATASTPSFFAGLGRERIAIAVGIAFLVLLTTSWPVLALAAGVLAALWGRLMHDDRAEQERLKVGAIATWLEDLRDTLRGSSVGAEEALESVALRPPEAISAALTTYAVRRRQGFRTEDALSDLAEDLAHPTSDAAIGAIRLVVGGAAGAGRLYTTVNALASAARDEVRTRERVDRVRTVYLSSMKRLVIIAACLIGYLRLAAGSLLEPYATPTGQAFLLIPLAMWAGCVYWLRSLCRYELPQRYRIVGSEPSQPAGRP